jgi:hypothetical protein
MGLPPLFFVDGAKSIFVMAVRGDELRIQNLKVTFFFQVEVQGFYERRKYGRFTWTPRSDPSSVT